MQSVVSFAHPLALYGELLFTSAYNPLPVRLHLFLYKVRVGRGRFVSSLVLLCRKRHGAFHR